MSGNDEHIRQARIYNEMVAGMTEAGRESFHQWERETGARNRAEKERRERARHRWYLCVFLLITIGPLVALVLRAQLELHGVIGAADAVFYGVAGAFVVVVALLTTTTTIDDRDPITFVVFLIIFGLLGFVCMGVWYGVLYEWNVPYAHHLVGY